LGRFSRIARSLVVFLAAGAASAVAQVGQVSHDVVPPVPGAGYDYVKALAETVDPQMGTLEVRVGLPMPAGRDMTLPFAFAYNSNLALHYVTVMGGQPVFNWTDNGSYLGRSGWRYVVPSLSLFSGSYFVGPNGGPPGPGGNLKCVFFADYSFTDEQGTQRDMRNAGASAGMGTSDPSPLCQGPGAPNTGIAGLSATDGTYSASTSQMASGQTSPPPVTVTDNDGTLYQFSNPLHYYPGDNANNVNLSAFSADTPTTLPSLIESRNGNQITITDQGKGIFSIIDQLGRSVLSSNGFGGTGGTASDTINVSGFGAYSATWSAPQSFNWPNNSETTLVSPGPNVGHCGPPLTSATGSQPVITQITLPNHQFFQFVYDPVTGLLNQITYPNGAVVSYTWTANPLAASNTYTVPPSTGSSSNITSICNLLHDTPAVQTRIVKFDGVHAALEQDFSYSTTWGTIEPTTGLRKWTTKQTTVTTKDLVRGTSFQTVYTYSQAALMQIANFAQTSSTAVYSTVDNLQGTGGSLLRTTTKSWSYYTNPPTTETVALDNGQTSEVISCYPIFTAPAPCPSVNVNSLLAILTDRYEYSYGSGQPGPLLRRTHYDYQSFPANPLGIAILDRPADVITYDANNNELAETDYAYDQQTSLASASATKHDDQKFSTTLVTSRGNVTTKTEKCFTGSGKSQQACPQGDLITSYTYDETGQPTSKTDAKGNTAQYSFADSFSDVGSSGNTNAYLTQITYPATVNAEGITVKHIVSFSYALSDGQLTTAVDENQQKTTYAYKDPLRRLTQTIYPDEGETDIAYDDAVPSVTTTEVNSGGNVVSVAIMDGMGRVIQTQLTSDPEGTIFTDTIYDGLGQKFKQSNPYRSQSESTYGLTTYTYDSLNRTTVVTHPDATSITTTYNGQDTEVSDEGNGTRSVKRISEADVLGRLTSVCEVTGLTLQANQAAPGACGQIALAATGFLTTYQYDLLGNLTLVEQGGLENRSFTYDSLSHLLTAFNPESGTIIYAYDANGNLKTKTAPQPNQTGSATVTTTYAYDALNRLLSKTFSDGTTPSATYNYDENTAFGQSISNPLGRKTSEISAGAKEVSSYDSMGRIQDSFQCLPPNCGTFYDLKYGHDALGNITSAGNGLGTTLSYAYDAANRLTSVTSSWSDANHPATLFSVPSNGYGPFGLVQANFGNSSQWAERRSYDNRGRIVSQLDSGLPPASSGTASITISGAEKQVQIVRATPGSGSLQLTGTLQPAEVASINLSQCGTATTPCPSPIGSASDTAHGTTSIFIVGNEQQWPQGLKPGTGSVTISSPTNGVQSVGTAPGSGVITVNGSEQSVGTAPGTGTVTINGTLQPPIQVLQSAATQATGSATVCGGDEYVSTYNVYDYGTVVIDLGVSGVYSVRYGANESTSTLASELFTAVSGTNSNSNFPVTATSVNGSTVNLAAKTPGSSGNNITLSARAASSAVQWNGYSYACTGASGPTLTNGQDAVYSTVYDSGSCTITVNGHPDSNNPSWSGSGTSGASIASNLVSVINKDSSAPVTATPSNNAVQLTAASKGDGTNYTFSSSCTHDSTHFSNSSFTTTNSGPALTGGQSNYDSGTVSVSLYPATPNFSCSSPGTTALATYSVPYSKGFSASSLAAALAGAIPASGGPVKASFSGNTVTLTATGNGANTNYEVCTSTPNWDKTDFPNGPSFTLTAPNSSSSNPANGSLSGGTTVYDSGIITLWVYGSASAAPNCSSPAATTPNTSYVASWGGSAASTSSVAVSLAAAIPPNNGGHVTAATPAAGSSVVNLTAAINGSISNFPMCLGYTYNKLFSQSSFVPTASGQTLTGGWPTAQATDAGTMTVTLNSTPYQATWGVNDSPSTIAAKLQSAIPNTSFNVNIAAVPASINLGITPQVYPGANPQTYAVNITPKTLGTAYTFATQTTYNTAFQPAEMQPDFAYPSFITLNSIYDYGTLQLAINGATDIFGWSSSDATPGAPVFYSTAVDAGGVTATPSGNTLTLASDQAGATTNYPWTASVANGDATDFPSLSVSAPANGVLKGGKAAVFGPDTGTVTINVNGYSKFTSYGGGDDSDSVALNVITTIHRDFEAGVAPVDATDGGAGTVILTAAASGSNTNYPFSVTAASSAGASPPSFSANPISGALSGGAGGGTTPQTLYSFSISTNSGTGYAPNGDVLNAVDSVNGSWSYQYDDLNRLISATDNTNQLLYTYLYDQFDNRWQENVAQIGNTQPPTSLSLLTFTGGNNRIDPAGVYLYDAAGNLLADGVNLYAYDAENRLACLNPNTSVTPWRCDANSINYVYNAEGERVQGPTYNYLYAEHGDTVVLNKSNGALAFHELNADGDHFATYTPGNTAFHFSDWLGTERYRSVVGASAAETCTSLPFGDGLDCHGQEWSLRHFTGKEHDLESGLDYFGARHYTSGSGRFMTPDWSAGASAVPYANLGDPASLNLYAYVHNNPVTGIDRDGHFNCSDGNSLLSSSAYCDFQRIDAANCGTFCQIKQWFESFFQNAANRMTAAAQGSPADDSNSVMTPGGPVSLNALQQQQVKDLAKGLEIVNITFAPADVGYATVLVDLSKGNNTGATITVALLLVPDASRIHHIATNKNAVFTPLFEKLFAKYGMSLQDEANKMVISSIFHYSSHPPEYHEWVLRTLRDATRGQKGEAGAAALRDALKRLQREIHQNPGRLSWP
jgi:RHS repeat-associated protein